MSLVCGSGAGAARALLARTAAKLEVGWIKGPGKSACHPPASVAFHQPMGQLGRRYPNLWRDAGVLSRKLFFESCLANVHRELSSSGNNQYNRAESRDAAGKLEEAERQGRRESTSRTRAASAIGVNGLGKTGPGRSDPPWR